MSEQFPVPVNEQPGVIENGEPTAKFSGDGWVAETPEGTTIIVENPPKQGDAITVTEYQKGDYETRPWASKRHDIVDSNTGEVIIPDPRTMPGYPIKR
jgi:hypothetical protein